MDSEAYDHLITLLNQRIIPLDESKGWLHQLLQKIDDARFVLIGEASHGSHEFYQLRMEITKALIQQKGFMAIAIEGDWPDAYRIHRYIQGQGDAKQSGSALKEFERFPQWMWRNTTMPPFLEWLRNHNDHLDTSQHKIGFYGLDLYSLEKSMQKVIEYLSTVDLQAAGRAKTRYACFDHMHQDPQEYGYFTSTGMKKACIAEVIAELQDLQLHGLKYLHHDGANAEDELFYATHNARLVKNAESYYRAMFSSRVSSWNVRDRHMVETLNVLADHLENKWGTPAKIVVWAHNSHVGDARATEMVGQGEVNVGQLVREQHAKTYNIGFSTYQGSVTAASDWDEAAEQKLIVPGMQGSYEALFHELCHNQFLLNCSGDNDLNHYLSIPRLQRAIGVIYRPDTERQSHYFFTRLPYQFNSLIHIDTTTALVPLQT